MDFTNDNRGIQLYQNFPPQMTNIDSSFYQNSSNIQMQMYANPQTVGGIYQCNHCTNNYRDSSALKRHVNEKHSGKEKRKCQEYQQNEPCNYETNRPYDMRRHLQRHKKEGGIKHSRFLGTSLNGLESGNIVYPLQGKNPTPPPEVQQQNIPYTLGQNYEALNDRREAYELKAKTLNKNSSPAQFVKCPYGGCQFSAPNNYLLMGHIQTLHQNVQSHNASVSSSNEGKTLTAASQKEPNQEQYQLSSFQANVKGTYQSLLTSQDPVLQMSGSRKQMGLKAMEQADISKTETKDSTKYQARDVIESSKIMIGDDKETKSDRGSFNVDTTSVQDEKPLSASIEKTPQETTLVTSKLHQCVECAFETANVNMLSSHIKKLHITEGTELEKSRNLIKFLLEKSPSVIESNLQLIKS